MKNKAQTTFLKKKTTRWGASVFLGLFLLVSTPEPAHADFMDVAEMTVEHAWAIIQDQLAKMQVSWAAAIEALGKNLQARIASLHTQALIDNGRQETLVKGAQDVSQHFSEPTKPDGTPLISACHVSERSAQATADHLMSGGAAAALAHGNANRPANATATATDIAAHCKMGFAPTASTDPEASAYTAMNGSQCPSTTHIREDLTPASLIEPMQFPMEPKMPLQKNGVYAPLTSVSGDQYMPYAAALAFCQNSTPTMPPPPQGVTGNPTANLTGMGQYNSAESLINFGPGTCFKYFTERTQVGANTQNYQAWYQQQAKLCREDHEIYIIDDAQFADCVTNGRSTLQADRDSAYRLGSTPYQTNVINLIPDFGQKQAVIAAYTAQQQKFDDRVDAELANLIAATQLAHNVVAPSSSKTSAPVSPN